MVRVLSSKVSSSECLERAELSTLNRKSETSGAACPSLALANGIHEAELHHAPVGAPFSLGKPEQMAARLTFFISGFGTAAWAPLVPLAKLRLAVDEGMLGLLLLCLGAGSIFTMSLAGAMVQSFGCRRVIGVAAMLVAIALPFLARVSSVAALGITLFIFGAGIGTLSCAANIQAVVVERASGRTMMSGFHGMYSLGGILGALGVSALLWLELPPLMATMMVATAILFALYGAWPGLLDIGSARQGPYFALPRGVLFFIGALCFVVFLAEGAMLDWSAVFLAEALVVSPSQAGLGYAAFALTMTLGRLGGDSIVSRLGGRKLLVLGALSAASGMTMVTLASEFWVALVGFAWIGVGCSNIVPIMFSEAGKQKDIAESVAIPAISTMAYSGVLLGPALIGFVAEATHLKTAFLCIAVLLAGVAAGATLLSK